MPAKSVSFRIDEHLKDEADEVLGEIGLNMTAALTMFLQQVVNKRAIPFVPEANDPFYNEENLNELRKRIKEYEEGKYIEHKLLEAD